MASPLHGVQHPADFPEPTMPTAPRILPYRCYAHMSEDIYVCLSLSQTEITGYTVHLALFTEQGITRLSVKTSLFPLALVKGPFCLPPPRPPAPCPTGGHLGCFVFVWLFQPIPHENPCPCDILNVWATPGGGAAGFGEGPHVALMTLQQGHTSCCPRWVLGVPTCPQPRHHSRLWNF